MLTYFFVFRRVLLPSFIFQVGKRRHELHGSTFAANLSQIASGAMPRAASHNLDSHVRAYIHCILLSAAEIQGLQGLTQGPKL